MKKNKVILLFILIITLFISCASSKKEKAESNSKVTKENKKTKTSKKSLIGWIDSSEKEIEFSSGIVNVKLKPMLGAFNFFVTGQDKKQIPVLSTANEYTSSTVQLKVGNKVYKLVSDVNVKVTAGKGEKNIYMNYEIPSVANLRIDFNFISSEADSNPDTLKIVYTVTNKGTKTNDFSVKTIYDTVLGENTSNHFFVAGDLPVKNEVMYRTMQNQKWIISKNNNASVQFLFDGGDCSATEIVALANKATLEKSVWEPELFSYKAFDTVLSYNNSGIGVIWPSIKIMPGKSAQITHYISFAVGENQVKGDKYVYSQIKKSDVSKKLIGFDEKKADEQNKKDDIQEFKQEIESKNVPQVEFNITSIEKEKLTAEYVNKLLKRISELEKDSSIANREEILMLNAELDYILSVLRKQ